MSSLPADSPRAAWRNRLDAFWRWWTAELSQAVPARLAGLHGTSRVPVLALESDEVVLVEPRAAAGRDARVAAATLDTAAAQSAIGALLQRAGESRARARLALPATESLSRRVTFPVATEENLRQVLAFEMDRLTPFRVDDVYFDHRVISRDSGAGTLQVLLGVARRDVVDAAIARVRRLGVNVQGVTLRDDLAAGPAALELMPSEQRGARETSRERIVRYGLIAAVVVLFAAVLVLPIWRKREAAIALLPQLQRAEVEARTTEGIAREVDRLAGEYNFALARKYAWHPVLAYIEELSRLLPDNTWLQQLDVRASGKTREIQMTGETPSSSRLIELLQQSQLLQNARTSGTVTRGTQPGTERFMITTDAMPRPAPEARSVLEDAGTAAAGTTPVPANPGATPAANPPAAPPPAAAKAQPAAPPAAAKVQPVVPPKPAAGK